MDSCAPAHSRNRRGQFAVTNPNDPVHDPGHVPVHDPAHVPVQDPGHIPGHVPVHDSVHVPVHECVSSAPFVPVRLVINPFARANAFARTNSAHPPLRFGHGVSTDRKAVPARCRWAPNRLARAQAAPRPKLSSAQTQAEEGFEFGDGVEN
eukprot:gene17493-biopygen6394